MILALSKTENKQWNTKITSLIKIFKKNKGGGEEVGNSKARLKICMPPNYKILNVKSRKCFVYGCILWCVQSTQNYNQLNIVHFACVRNANDKLLEKKSMFKYVGRQNLKKSAMWRHKNEGLSISF